MSLSAIARTVVFALPLLMSGCIEMEQDLTIAPDGSGTIKAHVALTEKDLEKMENIAKMAPKGEGDENANPLEVFDEKKTRDEAKKKGVDLQTYKTWTKDDKKHVEMVVAFKNVAEMRNSSLGNEDSDTFFLKGDKDGTVRMVIYPQGVEKHTKAVEEMKEMESAGKEAMEMQKAMLTMMKAQMKGLKITYRFTVPGKIVSVGEGLKKLNDTTAAFGFTDDDIKGPEDMQKLGAMKFEVVFEAKDLKIPLDKDEKPASRKAKPSEPEESMKDAKRVEPAKAKDKGDK